MSKAVAKKETNYMVPQVEAVQSMAEAMSEEMDGLQLSFDRIKVPSGGGLTFEIPGEDPDNPDVEKELIGVILDHHPVNAYWENKFEGKNEPPSCSSMDGKTGVGVPGGSCKNCPFNEYGSDGNGKACKNMHRVFVLREGDLLPVLLTLPPTSLRNFSNFMAKRIVTKGLRSYGIVAKAGLKKAQSADGITYSQVVFSVADKLSAEATATMKDYAANIKVLTRQLSVADDEYAAEAAEAEATMNEHGAGEKVPF